MDRGKIAIGLGHEKLGRLRALINRQSFQKALDDKNLP